jgi:hypothetical protein
MRKLFLPLIFVLSGCGDNTDPADTSTTAKEHAVFSVETDNPVVKRELPFIRQQLPAWISTRTVLKKSKYPRIANAR